MPTELHDLFRVGFVLIVLGVLCWAFWPRADFSIQMGLAGVQLRGKLPKCLHRQIAEFFRTEFPGRRVRVSGRWQRGSRLSLHFRGPLNGGERQRVRNFLTLLLR